MPRLRPLRPKPDELRREADPEGRNAPRGQTYAWGWLLAVSSLTGAANPDLFEVNGATLGAAHAAASLIVGIAAAAVRAWSWLVLLAAQALLLVYGAYYMTAIAQEPMDKTLVAVATVVLPGLQFVYFYKRRAMFGASWRWKRLERRCPVLVGPETREPGTVPGFAGLSHNWRLLFIIVVLVGIGIELFAWVTPKKLAPVDDTEQERQVTFRKEPRSGSEASRTSSTDSAATALAATSPPAPSGISYARAITAAPRSR